MDIEIDSVYDGKVSGITKFGAFVTFGDGKNGMVHISEVANSYVNDIREHLSEGQDVKVKVIGIDNIGRINLSIKRALAPDKPAYSGAGRRPQNNPRSNGNMSFEEKLKQFMQESETRMPDTRFQEKRSSRRRSSRP